jgi:hypothetical protein
VHQHFFRAQLPEVSLLGQVCKLLVECFVMTHAVARVCFIVVLAGVMRMTVLVVFAAVSNLQ